MPNKCWYFIFQPLEFSLKKFEETMMKRNFHRSILLMNSLFLKGERYMNLLKRECREKVAINEITVLFLSSHSNAYQLVSEHTCFIWNDAMKYIVLHPCYFQRIPIYHEVLYGSFFWKFVTVVWPYLQEHWGFTVMTIQVIEFFILFFI